MGFRYKWATNVRHSSRANECAPITENVPCITGTKRPGDIWRSCTPTRATPEAIARYTALGWEVEIRNRDIRPGANTLA